MIDDEGTGYLALVGAIKPLLLKEKVFGETWDGKHERLPGPGCNQPPVAQSEEEQTPF